MTTPARQPQGIPAGGQFAPDTRAEPAITLNRDADQVHAVELSGAIELRNASFDQLPDWPATMPQPEVSFGFSGGKCETSVTVDGKIMNFWEADGDGTINDTDNGTNPWEDFDEEDQEKALEWGKRVHQRIDSSTYGIMIEATGSPAVNDTVLAHALGKEPAPAPKPAVEEAPDLKNETARNVYLADAERRLAGLRREVQNIYMIGAAQELRDEFPVIDCFQLAVGGKSLEISEAWDADGDHVASKTIRAASRAVFRFRDEDDFSTFLDGQVITVGDAINFRPAT